MSIDGTTRTRHAEVQYFFQMNVNLECRTLAMVSLYTEPNPGMLQDSYNTLLVC